MENYYKTSPIDILLENYILYLIDELSDDKIEALKSIEPELAKIFHKQGTWTDILKNEFELSADFEEKVREIWLGNVSQLGKSKANPVEFTKAFVKSNFK